MVRGGVVVVAVMVVMMTSAVRAQEKWADAANWFKMSDVKATQDIVYTQPDYKGYSPKSQVLNLYLNNATPKGKKSPVFVHVHGGGWDHGHRFDGNGPMDAWISAGFSAIDVEYRMTPEAPAPAALQDVRCALSWVVANADKYSFDTDKVVLYGESAGGHLTLLSAYMPADNPYDLPQCKVQPKIVAELSFFGPYSMQDSDPGAYTRPNGKKWVGNDAMAKAMSPITYVRPGVPPTFMAHGDADPLVPFAGTQLLQKALTKAGVKNYLDVVPGGGHGGWPKDQDNRTRVDSLRFLKTLEVIQ